MEKFYRQYNQKTIEECMKTKRLGRRLLFYESIGSTNEQAHLIAGQESAHDAEAVAGQESAHDAGAAAGQENAHDAGAAAGQENAHDAGAVVLQGSVHDAEAVVLQEDKHDAVAVGFEDVHGTLVVADRQTAGKGRRGRVWESPAGTNIYFTLLLKPTFSPDKASMLTLLMAYAVKEAVDMQLTSCSGTSAEARSCEGKNRNSAPLHCTIKWPNDIVVNGRKVCGILTEMHLEGTSIHHVVIGVGINVGKQDFAPEIVEKATSLEAECGQAISRSRLIADIMQIFETEYEDFAAQDASQDLKKFKDRYNACLVNKDREVCVLDPKGEYRGMARGINDTGELLVELADGTVKAVYAGEVSVRGIYGYA